MALSMDPQPGMGIYDPTCGSAGLLIKCELALDGKMKALECGGTTPLSRSAIRRANQSADTSAHSKRGWVQHILASLKPQGRAAVVLDTGSGNANTNVEELDGLDEESIKRNAALNRILVGIGV